MSSDLEVGLEVGGREAGEGDGRSSLQDRRSGSGTGTGGDGGRINRREQGLKITLATYGVYLAFNGLLYVVIQINYQNQRNSPFKTHMAMKSSLVALCVYFCAAALKIKFAQTNTKLDESGLLNHVLGCSGILIPLSNALVFLPNKVGFIVVVLFVFATTILLAYHVYKLIFKCISERNNSENNYAATTSEPVVTTSEPVASEITGIGDNAATTSESGEINNESNRNSNNAETTSESEEMNNESSRNNNDAVEVRT